MNYRFSDRRGIMRNEKTRLLLTQSPFGWLLTNTKSYRTRPFIALLCPLYSLYSVSDNEAKLCKNDSLILIGCPHNLGVAYCFTSSVKKFSVTRNDISRLFHWYILPCQFVILSLFFQMLFSQFSSYATTICSCIGNSYLIYAILVTKVSHVSRLDLLFMKQIILEKL